MKRNFQLLHSKGFVFCLILLLLNDFYFKGHWHNWLTGKLSDFTGLFVFSVFFIAFIPNKKQLILIFAALFFIFWKSAYSATLINYLNSFHIITIGRVVDYSDYMALLILPVVNYYINHQKENKLKKIPVILFSMITLFAMTATSYQKSYSYNKLYPFDFGKEELVKRINKIKGICQNISLSYNVKNADSILDINGGKNSVHISGYNQFDDTMFKYKGDKKVGIDTIYHYNNAIVDTIYINETSKIELNIQVRKHITKSESGYCNCLPFSLTIKGDNQHSSILLEDVSISNCMGMFENKEEPIEKSELLKAFESELIDKIKQ